MSPAAATPRTVSAAALILAVLLMAVMLTGCGKKGLPQPPPDEPNTYPQPYPRE
jgi:predicted small lipoprotein YifL